ncbi:BMP family ABC transporter substrate-binding protein [Mycoplasmopsis agalactiae]|uniref:BMP family ABC transporter substrate-binding protein n=1 Tax=Mycoplasmopsis agalactiae TaxID=2110 RepID=UPI001F90EC4C|nr:BMP family ABC transporter substrate-binding protein [Mycoplasmopsis agalactiae]MCE6114897.1 BMP family ABC transporter substrate-binding protein [Mycoplasmopsis agalactiae]
MKKNKFYLFLGAAPVLSVPLVAASCGDKYFKETEVDGVKTISTLAHITSRKGLKLREGLTVENAPKATFITDEGSVHDESFNQSGWEAVHKVSYELGLDKAQVSGNKNLRNKVYEPKKGQLLEAYKNAIDSGFRYIVLCGFTHQASLVGLDENYIKKIKDNNIIFITVDFNLFTEDEANVKTFINKIGEGHLVPVIFDTKQAAYIAGRALADYFSQVYKEQPEKRTIGAFGGIPWPAVSDFIAGTFQGIIDWNKEHPEGKTKSLNETIELNTLFTSGTPQATTAINSVVKATASYPVAGSLSTDTAKEIKKLADKDKFIIGVDADQKNALKGHRIFTSVMKLIGQAVYNILADLYSKGENQLDLQPEFKIGKKDGTPTVFGYGDTEDKQYVGVATSGLLDDKNDEIANKALKDATEHYVKNKTQIQETLKKQMETAKKALGTKFPSDPGGQFQKMVDWLASETRK